MKAETINITINCDWRQVYDFVSDLNNFPKWAKTFCQSIKKIEAPWYEIDTPQGPTQIRITTRNEYGVADHYIISPKGDEVYVPMRVIPNGAGCELLFTLFQRPGMTDEMFKSDRALVLKDLETLKEVMGK